jgi:hypothetical protein
MTIAPSPGRIAQVEGKNEMSVIFEYDFGTEL